MGSIPVRMTNSGADVYPASGHQLLSCFGRAVQLLTTGVALAGLCLVSNLAMGQTAYFSGITSIAASGFNTPSSVAFDASGNMFVADRGTSHIKELTAASGYSAVTNIGGSFPFSSPTGVAVDSYGNVFVGDTMNNAVEEISAASGYSTVTVLNSSSFNQPLRIAVDAQENVFVADSGNNAVKEIRPSDYTAAVTLGSGFSAPSGVAVDLSGNVYVADTGNNAIKEILASAGYTTTNTLVSGLNGPDGVWADLSGNVFFADTHNAVVKEILAVNGSIPSSPAILTLGSKETLPVAVAVTGKDDVFVADHTANVIYKIQLSVSSFGNVQVGSAGPVVSLPFVFLTGGTLQAPNILTAGVSGLDFKDANTGTCDTNGSSHTYAAGDSCTVDVRFIPAVAGLRSGAVELLDSSGAVLATASVAGNGVGPQITWSPATQKSLGSGFSSPGGVAVDGARNIIVADAQNNAVREIQAGTGYTSVGTLGSGFSQPQGVALDAGGNIFVADTGNNAVREILSAGGYSTVKTLAAGFTFSAPSAIAVDSSGNVYVADTGNNAVEELPAAGGYGSVMVLGTGFNAPSGLAVDANGNVDVADTGNGALKQIVAASGVVLPGPTVNTLLSGLAAPRGLAVDAVGNLYCSESGNGDIVQIMAVGGNIPASPTVNKLATGLTQPAGVAVDGNFNVYFATSGDDKITKLGYDAAPSFTFQTTTVSTTSSDSPQTLTVTNAGNANLILTVPGSGTNASISPNFALGSSSTCPQVTPSGSPATIAAGSSCNYLISFTPGAAGSIQGSLNLSDNNLNGTNATQSVLLSGTGANIAITPTSLSAAQVGVAYAPVSVTSSGGTGPYTYSTTSGSLPAGLTLSSAGLISGTPTQAGTFSFTITAADSGSLTGSQAYTLAVAAPAIALAPAALPTGQTYTAYNQTFSATGGTGPYTYSLSGGSLPAGLTLSPGGVLSGTPTVSGSFSVSVTAADSSTGTDPGTGAKAPFSAAKTYTLVISAPGITVSPAALASGQVGLAYAGASFSANGGSGSYTWKLSAGTLPGGLILSSAGALSGTPTQAGSFSFTVTATDANNFSGSHAYSIAVNAPSLSLAPGSLPAGQSYGAYSQSFSASGGTPPYNYTITAGTLPSGLTLTSAGLLSGTPTASGSFSIKVTATDSSTGTSAPFSVTNAYTLTISTPAITITPAAVPSGQAGVAFPVQLFSASGGAGPYTWSIAAGALPAGLSLTPSGVLYGTATAAGNFSFTIAVTDSNGFSGRQSYSLKVTGPAISMTPASLPPGRDGVSYSPQLLTASGGTAPYSYKVVAGSLPTGLALTSSGLLSGTPTAGGPFSFTISATDSNGFAGTQAYSLTISVPTITVEPAGLAAGQVGTAYSQSITAAGGVPPFTYAETGALPAGLVFNPTTGLFSGTPKASGTFPISVTATDSSTGTGPYKGSSSFSLVVNGTTPTLSFAAVPPQTYGNAPFAVSASSASSGAVEYSVISGPAIINAASGLVTLRGAGSVTIEASQAAASGYASATAQITIDVARQAAIMSLTASSPSIAPNQSLTLTATAVPYVSGTPGGTVTFYDSTTRLGSATLAQGAAHLVLSSLTPGQHLFNAVYAGDANFLQSSATMADAVAVAPLDFTLNPAGAANQTVTVGSAASWAFSLTPLYGRYPGPVTLSATGLPAGATATFSASSLPSTAGPQTVTLTVQTSRTTALNVLPGNASRLAVLALALLLPFGGMRRFRRSGRRLSGLLGLVAILALGVAALLPLSGCGENTKFPAQSYNVVVTASSGTVQHTASVDLDINY